ncbi:PEP-CTERM/exosortase A-associated glycosyltransferase [Rhodothalassium salexigens DSM 2132]|uniref:PEP-CTERM/exosortase A-associated glycosyltransferase n=1 Tax=Rhodothalassium salexigens DSM 2132 TaxID=1188247 RepID=A0A4R2PGY7_RHOSA|nr:TIGR04063 family PEP-CTERM/XrtA system glycosyltransferase [Rhodothalassium salexigens]MBB4211571.1 PEP-CTERM/exosortase A-associated glycosyltransferase [Rhodothalassium salexigens DSM 2132]MBK1638409.1 glycosyltransferase, exosortase A system-associated [Rhodothalassium salexigens DSM 2132]TCP34497.1 PEP-CTERM/exosortase A-associated glycosyltransferase [Rhodothalassium salexigens DSM 2132]
MHILHVYDHSLPLHSGYAFRSRALLREQRALGWTTSHVTSAKHNPDTVPPRTEEADGLLFHRTAPSTAGPGFVPGIDQWRTIVGLQARLAALIGSLKPDIVHAHSPALNGVAAIRAARRCGVPVVYEIRGFWEDAAVSHGTAREGNLRYRLTRGLESWAVRRADAVMAICDGIRGDLIARGVPADKITLIPNAVDADRFNRIDTRDDALAAALGVAGCKTVGFIGSFYRYEGLDLLVDALPSMLDADPQVRGLLVGGGPMEADLKAQAEARGVADKVIFTGRVAHDQVARYYSVIDVLAYPRTPQRITDLVTPLKPLEAMAQHRLFVASDVGGHRELVRDGETGLLFRAGDAQALADTITDLFGASEARRDSLKAAGRRFVEEERTWARSAANYAPVYERLMGRAYR